MKTITMPDAQIKWLREQMELELSKAPETHRGHFLAVLGSLNKGKPIGETRRLNGFTKIADMKDIEITIVKKNNQFELGFHDKELGYLGKLMPYKGAE